MQIKTNKQSEGGQSIVIMAFGLIVLLGMLALAVDGGRAYTERRRAQNAATASAMAAVRELGSGASSVTAQRVAHDTAVQNGYNPNPTDITVQAIPLNYGGTYNTGKTAAYSVTVFIDSGIGTAFAQLIFDNFIDVDAKSVMEVRLPQDPLSGFGIVSLNQSCSGNSNGAGVGVGGGGNSGGVEVFGSNILINVPNPNNNCAFDPPNSGGNDGIFAYNCPPDPINASPLIPCTMQVVGDYTCPPNENCASLGPVNSGFNGGQPLPDPLASLPKPTCLADYTSAGVPSDQVYNPGTWYDRDLGEGTYNPGIYCILRATNGSSFGTTQGMIDASSGVLFFFKDTGNGPPDLDLAGQAKLDLRAPGNGTGNLPCQTDPNYQVPQTLAGIDPTDPCHYKGLAIFVDRGTASELELGGNGVFNIYGTIYGANAVLTGSGGGSETYEINVWGQVLTSQVLNDGNGSLKVWYRDDLVYKLPSFINALD